MTEVDDALPGLLLLVVPDAGAARGDASVGRGADHLGHDKPGAAERAGAEVDQVELAGDTVDGRVHVHRRDDNPVGELEIAKFEGQEHRRTDGRARRHSTASDVAREQPVVDSADELRIAVAQVVVGDATAAGHHVEDELGGVLVDVLANLLEPDEARLRCALRALHDRQALVVVGLEGGFDGRLLEHAGGECQGVLHRELRARADREVGGVCRVAEQGHVLVDEGLVADRAEGDPLAVVRDEAAAGEGIGEDLADPLDALGVAHSGRKAGRIDPVEPGTMPDVLGPLDDERARVGVHRVGMHLHDAPLCFLDEELEGVEDRVRAEPDELAPTRVDRRAELRCVGIADRGVDAIAGEDEVVARHELLDRRGLGAEQDVDAVRQRAALQHMEQLLAAHRREAVAADGDGLVAQRDVDIVPVGERLAHVVKGRAVGCLDTAERLVAEHHPEAEGVIGGVALPHGDLGVGVQLLDQAREVEAAGATADNRDPHGCRPPLVLRIIDCRK
ncbi:unannotated protein [freshwater metagenome]|uniref:Unannotated protein n=1 Tax=freshwater metagenome TaxID=449393 RepID=A0A6J7HRP1_9ZZZZ